MSRGQILRGVCLWAVSFALRAQMQDSGEVRLRSDTRVVEVDVTVQDAQGHPVRDLSAADFRILDEGKPRTFSIFRLNDEGVKADVVSSSPPPPLPGVQLPPNSFTNAGLSARPRDSHASVILLDGINGWFDNFALARQGVIGMLNKLPPDERVALYVIAKNQGLAILQDYTTDRGRLLEAISKYIPRAMCAAPIGIENGEGMVDPIQPLSGPPPPPSDAAVDSAETSRSARMAALRRVTKPSPCITPGPKGWDLMEAGAEAVRLSLNALASTLARQPGRKSVYWVSQGFPVTQLRGEFENSWNKTISALNDANIAVNAIDSNGLGGPPRMWGPGEILAMKRLAQDTGGQTYYFRNDIDAVLANAITESRVSYTLGFYLTDVDARYHDLKVSVDRPGLTLGYRQGYFAADEPPMDPEQKRGDLSTVLLNPSDSAAVGMVATLELTRSKPRDLLQVKLRLDAATLSVQEDGAGLNGKVEEMFVEFNGAGREVGRVSAASPFAIGTADKAAFEANGVTMVQSVPLAAGAVKLSIIVRDTAGGRVGSLTVPLEGIVAADGGR